MKNFNIFEKNRDKGTKLWYENAPWNLLFEKPKKSFLVKWPYTVFLKMTADRTSGETQCISIRHSLLLFSSEWVINVWEILSRDDTWSHDLWPLPVTQTTGVSLAPKMSNYINRGIFKISDASRPLITYILVPNST